jgi:hypothetical protein
MRKPDICSLALDFENMIFKIEEKKEICLKRNISKDKLSQ